MSEEEKDNVFKINMPIFTNEELIRLDDMIENDIDNIINQISKTVSKDREVIFLKKVIDKLQKENQDYKKLILAIKGKLNNIQFEVEQAWRKIEKLESKYE